MVADVDEDCSGWLKVEYEALHRAGVNINESFFKLAQMSFVLNPALAVGYAYVLVEEKFGKFSIVAFLIAVLALVYNTGAVANYRDLHKRMALLLRRLLQIEEICGGRLRYYFRQSCPIWYREHVAKDSLRQQSVEQKTEEQLEVREFSAYGRYLNVHVLTKVFFTCIISGWFIAIFYSGWAVAKYYIGNDDGVDLHHLIKK